MARPKSQQPTDGELEILRVLWDAGPTELGQVRAALLDRRGRDIALTTVATMLKVMLDKGLVTRRAKAADAGPWLWSAKVSRHTATRGMLRKILSNVFEGSASKLVVHLIEDGRLTPAEQQEIRALLDDHARRSK
jgi:BlaI family penicillinase repressor